ncbi:MAG: hypothetical protein ACYC6M_05125 [Terriglobales bacterium]
MKTRRIRKSDGRYLILYEFPAPQTASGKTPAATPAVPDTPSAPIAKAASKPRPKR